MVAELLHEVLVELRGVLVSELRPDLEDDDLRLCLREEPLEVCQDDVDAVGFEDSVAHTAVLLDADVEDSCAGDELVVDGERLALREGARDEADPDLVCGGVVSPWPDDLVDVELLGSDAGHPVFAIGGDVIAAGELAAAGLLEIGEGFLLGGDGFATLELFRKVRPHW